MGGARRNADAGAHRSRTTLTVMDRPESRRQESNLSSSVTRFCGNALGAMTLAFHPGGEVPKLVLPLLLLLLLAMPLSLASAHPGVGLVRDRLGNVFYTDLVHVWRITPAGQKSIVVRNVHTHELAVDSLGNVYGEDSRYLGSGEGDDRYRHRIWRRSPNGRITYIVPWRTGFWPEYGFVRDRSGAMYWIKCPAQRCSIHRRTASPAAAARTTIVATPGQFTRPINWFAASVTEPGVPGRRPCRAH